MSSPKKLVIAGLSATAVVASIGYAFAQSSDDTALANSNWNGAQNSAEDATAANAGPPAMPPSAVSAYNAEINAAGAMGDQSTTPTTTTSIDTSSASSSSMAATDSSTSPWSADSSQSSSSTAATTTDPNAASPGPANPTAGTSPDKTDITHPAVEPQGSAMKADTATNPSMTTNTTTSTTVAPSPAPSAAPAQTETRVDLNSPNEPQYNLASDPWLRHRNTHNSNNTGSAADNTNTTATTGNSGERAPRADRN
jgi:hypothetical protein